MYEAPQVISVNPFSASTLVDLIDSAAGNHQVAYVYLLDGETIEEKITFDEIHKKARSAAALIQEAGLNSGDRAVLIFSPGLDFIIAFCGCLYAGVIAVPVSVPSGKRSARALESVISDAQPSAIIVDMAVAESQGEFSTRIKALIIDHKQLVEERIPVRSRITPETIAFIQYTSGSTSAPKGVMVTHGNLIANETMLQVASNSMSGCTWVSWLPQYHDMGLIAPILQTLFMQGRCVLMSPFAFLESPARWLKAMSRYKAEVSVAPNFGYELSIKRVRDEDLKVLDLSSWRIAFNAAEPIRSSTLSRFAERFSQCGLRTTALCPGYGLAESTLIVTATPPFSEPVIETFDAYALYTGLVIPATNTDGKVYSAVGCGVTSLEGCVRIVDPETCTACDSKVGEIWVGGPQVAAGYWRNPQETNRVFKAQIVGEDGEYLRTGDLGFIFNGDLFVVGRIKDTIIIRGKNVFAQDIELAAEHAHNLVRAGCCAAFAVEKENEEQVVVVAEVAKVTQANQLPAIEKAIRKAIFEEFHFSVRDIALIGTGEIFKTTSGKIQRGATRKAWLDKRLNILNVCTPANDGLDSKTSHIHTQEELLVFVRKWICERLEIPLFSIRDDAHFSDFGLDSLTAVDLRCSLESHLNRKLPEKTIWDHPTISKLCHFLSVCAPVAAPSNGKHTPIAINATNHRAKALQSNLADFRLLPGPDLFDRIAPFDEWHSLRRKKGVWSYSRALHGQPGGRVRLQNEDGRIYEGLNFGSIDYLGLSTHSSVIDAAAEALHTFGPHSASVPMFSGNSLVTLQLEQELGSLLRTDFVLLMASGWAAGWGAVAGLVRESDHVVLDVLAHNCMQHGARSATANVVHFPHLDYHRAEECLAAIRQKDTSNGILLVTEGLFSMDSDWPDLAKFQKLAHQYGARMLVDISHDIGSMGPDGSSMIGVQGLLGEIDIICGGFSKGLAASGGFIATNRPEVKQYLKCYTDPFVFGTSMSPISAACALAAIRVSRSPQGESLRENLQNSSKAMRDEFCNHGIKCIGDISPIVPALIPSEGVARVACKRAFERGVIVNLVEYPAVPMGMPRFRLQLMAHHSEEDGRFAAKVLSECIQEAQSTLARVGTF